MSKKLRKVKALLGRIQFIDLAAAIAVPLPKRKDHLRKFVQRALAEARMPSYEYFRRAIPDIYGVVRPLDLSPALTMAEIEKLLRRGCHPDDFGMNLEVSELLFDFVRPRRYMCYDHPAHDLSFGPSRKAQIRINHFVVDGDRGVFQFVFPRRDPPNGRELQLMGSLIHHNYVQGDYSESAVEIVDLSCPKHLVGRRGGITSGNIRRPRLHLIARDEILGRAELEPEISECSRPADRDWPRG